MQQNSGMLHAFLKKIFFFFVCLNIVPSAAFAQKAVMGQFAHRYAKPYPVERRFMWQPAQKTRAFGISNLHALVLLAEYNDVTYTHTRDDFEKTLNTQEFSARKYFQDQLGQDVDITIAGPFKVKKNRAYYGTNNSEGADMYPGTFIADVCTAADGEIDFSLFDDDGDGYVDNVYVFYAGEDESQQKKDKLGRAENPDFMWSHSWTLEASEYRKTLELDGVRINSYACSSELYRIYTSAETYNDVIAPIGTFCHEHSHIFGLSDLYDTDYEKSGGLAAGTWGKTSLMDSGNYNNNGTTPPNYDIIIRETIGIEQAEELKAGKYTMIPAGRSGARAFKISNPADSAEYYLFECRANEGWDKHIGGKGLLVYHIDKSTNYKTASETSAKDLVSKDRWRPYNQVNCRPDHQCADLIEADGRSDASPSDASLSDISGIFFPQTGATSIGGNANIKLSFWDGTSSSLTVNEIALDGDGCISFSVRDEYSPIPPDPVNPPTETEMLYIIVQDNGSSVELDVNNTVSATQVRWFFNGRQIDDCNAFIPEGNGEIRAEVYWPDGSVDYCIKEWRGRK